VPVRRRLEQEVGALASGQGLAHAGEAWSCCCAERVQAWDDDRHGAGFEEGIMASERLDGLE
jgi:hypothetical protein